jgi:hypothetical protein
MRYFAFRIHVVRKEIVSVPDINVAATESVARYEATS